MPIVTVHTRIRAPRARVFDLARDVEAHVRSTAGTGETVVAAPRRLLEAGDEVTWRARHLGVTQELTSRIVQYDRSSHFRDSMVRGAFARFDHDHFFEERSAGSETDMHDRFDYTAPLGPLGRVADVLFLERYVERLLRKRAQVLKELSETP